MPDKMIRRLLVLGGLVIIGLIFTQSYWMVKTWDLKDQEFDLSARKVLLQVARRISKFNQTKLPKKNLIQRTASNYYAVNINSGIDANILEDYLYQEMGNQSLKTDFEYSVFDCSSKEVVYGNYCNLANPDIEIERKDDHPIFSELDYYFVVSFPSRESYVLSNMRMTVLFSIIAILSVIFFLYAMWIVLKQKRLSELQKDFINNMTHEFKTPISSIKLAADVLSKHKDITKDTRLSRYATIITEQNNRLNDQVEKVLNIARLEKDSFELKKVKLNLDETLGEIINNEVIKLEKGSIDLKIIDEKLEIFADQLHFTNVITNIIDNAIKYSTQAPKIIISTLKNQDVIEISIQDNGIGIEKEKIKNIFDKFYRVSTGNVHDVKGFGLGLFYVKNICRAHGWYIQAGSIINKGTKFTIKIPINN
ncbi:MAG: HAMP domain-containing sensor histidine kinase [Saprospiraceae bacterium]